MNNQPRPLVKPREKLGRPYCPLDRSLAVDGREPATIASLSKSGVAVLPVLSLLSDGVRSNAPLQAYMRLSGFSQATIIAGLKNLKQHKLFQVRYYSRLNPRIGITRRRCRRDLLPPLRDSRSLHGILDRQIMLTYAWRDIRPLGRSLLLVLLTLTRPPAVRKFVKQITFRMIPELVDIGDKCTLTGKAFDWQRLMTTELDDETKKIMAKHLPFPTLCTGDDGIDKDELCTLAAVNRRSLPEAIERLEQRRLVRDFSVPGSSRRRLFVRPGDSLSPLGSSERGG